MKPFLLPAPLLLCFAVFATGATPQKETRAPASRRVWTANLTLETGDPARTAKQAETLAELCGGRVEHRTDDVGHGTTLHLLLPANNFADVLRTLETNGTLVSRQVETKDVSESCAEAEMQLQNRIALRDRLRDLLDRTDAADDVLAVETELNQAQADVDSAEARLRSYKVRIEWGKAIVVFRPAPQARQPILGPLGYLFKGLSWTVGKLFVIRDGEPPQPTAPAIAWHEPPPPPPAPGAAESLKYVVQEGDTLEGIGRLFVVTADDLRRANPGIGGRDAFPGETIFIPPAK